MGLQCNCQHTFNWSIQNIVPSFLTNDDNQWQPWFTTLLNMTSSIRLPLLASYKVSGDRLICDLLHFDIRCPVPTRMLVSHFTLIRHVDLEAVIYRSIVYLSNVYIGWCRLETSSDAAPTIVELLKNTIWTRNPSLFSLSLPVAPRGVSP